MAVLVGLGCVAAFLVVSALTLVRGPFATAFVYGADNVLSIVEVRDLAGNATTPLIVTSGTFQVR